MKFETELNVLSSFAGEAMAHFKYLTWGKKAANDGFENVGRLFEAVAFAERVHATHFFAVLGAKRGESLVPVFTEIGLGSTSENLAMAISAETKESEVRYPALFDIAKLQDSDTAEWAFKHALNSEKTHADLFTKAKKAVDSNTDMELGPVQVCITCGYTIEGDAPEKCPLCGAETDKFKTFE